MITDFNKFVPPFKHDRDLAMPLHALNYPSRWVTITDAEGATVVLVPAVIDYKYKDGPIILGEDTLKLADSIVDALNKTVNHTK